MAAILILVGILFFGKQNLRRVIVNYHVKFGASRFKIDWVISNQFSFWWPFYFLAAILFFGGSLWTTMQNLEYIAWKLIELFPFSFWQPFCFFLGKMWRVIVNYHAKSGANSLKIDWVMLNLVFGGHFVFWQPFYFSQKYHIFWWKFHASILKNGWKK